MRTLPYDLNGEYIKGSTNHLANCISQLEPLDGQINPPTWQMYEIPRRLAATTSRIQLLHEATAQHDDMCLLKHIVQAG